MTYCRGTALLMCLLTIAVVVLLGLSGAHIALQDERAGRNDRDRTLAFQAAEAALLDAQLDIEQGPNTARGALFGTAAPRFPAECATAGANDIGTIGNVSNVSTSGTLLGLCDGQPDGAAWQRADFTDETAAGANTVPYGQFTGQVMQAGTGALPQRLPRYLIEAYADRRAGVVADLSTSARIYRISAMGFGAQDGTRVLLQAWYRRIGAN